MIALPQVVAFDVIETLFSLDAVNARFENAGLSPPALDLWLATGQRDAFALAASEAYAPFRDVLAAALDEVSASVGHPLTDAPSRKRRIWGHLPAGPVDGWGRPFKAASGRLPPCGRLRRRRAR